MPWFFIIKKLSTFIRYLLPIMKSGTRAISHHTAGMFMRGETNNGLV